MKAPNSLHYLTTDAQNADLAAALAAQAGLDLEIAEPRDLPRLERNHADVVLDFDFLPDDYRTALLDGRDGVRVVAVHGYDLGDGLASFLPSRGIVCGPRLDGRLFAALATRTAAA